MTDLFNNFPSWGQTGTYPTDGFFYEGGDQVNEKHLDALWNGVQVHINNINDAIRDRVRDISGNIVLDGGLVASQGSGTREVDVTASSDGAYVDGERTGSTSATTLTLSSNGSGSQRTDVVWVNSDGTVGKTEGQTTVASDEMKLAEVDVETDDTISAVRNYARDHADHVAAENAPLNLADRGDLWHDLTEQRLKVHQNGAYRRVITEDNIGPGIESDAGNVELDDETYASVDQSGNVASGNAANAHTRSLADGETLEVHWASFIGSDGTPVPSGVDMIIATLDGSGGGTSQVTVLNGDGSTQYGDESGEPLASYTNNSGSPETVMIAADNGQFNSGSGGDADVQLSTNVKVT